MTKDFPTGQEQCCFKAKLEGAPPVSYAQFHPFETTDLDCSSELSLKDVWLRVYGQC